MVLNISGKEYNNENYEFSIYINDVEINCNHIANDVHIPYKPNDIITVECKNVLFEGKGSLFWMMVYWILALVSGYGEKNPFVHNKLCLASMYWSVRDDVKALIQEAQFDFIIIVWYNINAKQNFIFQTGIRFV